MTTSTRDETTQDDAAQWREVAEQMAINIARDVAELPDRTSPPDEPLLLLVTERELQELSIDRISEVLASATAAIRQERDDYRADYLRRHKDACDQIELRIAAEARCAAMQAVVDAARQFERTGNWQLAAKALDALPPNTAKE